MRTENECNCACHSNPTVMHCVPCCQPYLGTGNSHFCEHANECPQSCPCADDCYCKGRTCVYRPRR